MKYSITFTLYAASTILAAIPGYTWPNLHIDELEDTMFLLSGFGRKGFFDNVTPCSSSAGNGPTRINAAEWVRTAFHDAATHDAVKGTGGMDASIQFETDRDENVGKFANASFSFFLNYYSKYSSMADLIAMGTYTAVRSCGGPSIPVRIGRVDAKARGILGVPQPQEDQKTITSRFAKMGFNTTDMITMTACGHTLGGVHGEDFPTIVGDNSTFSHFDRTFDNFDNKVVTEYVSNNTTNPLVVGRDKTRLSDLKVFTADNNRTMKSLTNPAAFRARCQDILGRMIDVVPSNVKLSPPLTPIDIKPWGISITLDKSDNLIFTGDIRVRTTQRKDNNRIVTLTYADRNGKLSTTNTIPTNQETFQGGTGLGFDEQFTFYSFSKTIPASTGISHFNITITSANQPKQVYTNSPARGFPINDLILLQPTQSCLVIPDTGADVKPWSMTVTVAVHNSLANSKNPTTLDLTIPVKQANSMVPGFVQKVMTMKRVAEDAAVVKAGYTLFKATYMVQPEMSTRTTFDVVNGASRLVYVNSGSLNSACATA